MDFLINYWWLLLVAIAAISVAGVTIYKFFNTPTNEQLQKVREWLLQAVTMAEKELGEKTGQVKLSYVYDMFIEKFPKLAALISAETFSDLVDGVLVKFRQLLNSNESLQNYVKGDKQE